MSIDFSSTSIEFSLFDEKEDFLELMIKYLASIILIRHIIFIDDEDLSGNNEVSWPENCISQFVFSSRVPLFVTISDQVLIFDDVFNSVHRGHLSIGAVWLQVSPRNAIERFQCSKD